MSEIKESRFIRFACYAVLILLVVYVLSIGPVVALLIDSNGDLVHPKYVKQFMYFYYPLTLLIDNNKLIRDAYISYVNICNDSNIIVQ